VLANDGCIYAVPYKHNKILKIDPTIFTTTQVAKPILFGGPHKYYGGVKANNGCIYFAPHGAKQVLRFDPKRQTTERIGKVYRGSYKWTGGAIDKDGYIYFAPYNASRILRVDPTNNGTVMIGKDFGKHNSKFSGCVASKDGSKICFIPCKSQSLLIYDTTNPDSNSKGCTEIDIHHLLESKSDMMWDGGVLGTDGYIYCIPDRANQILKYHPVKKKPTLVGENLEDSLRKFSGGVMGKDGCIYCIPRETKKVLKYCIYDNTSTFLGKSYDGRFKWSGGVLDEKGDIIGIPFRISRVLRVNPSLKPGYSCGINDSPNGKADRLGRQSYAEALVQQVISMEESSDTAISVGLYSPWGSGNSFFWNLIKEEFRASNSIKANGALNKDNSDPDEDDIDLNEENSENEFNWRAYLYECCVYYFRIGTLPECLPRRK